MKRFFAYTIILLALAGCQINHSSNTVVSNDELSYYASYQFGKCVAMPAELLNVVLDFDKYLKMRDEEKILDENIFGLATYLGEDSYSTSHHHIGITCTLDTGGKSILEPGTVWKFSKIGYYGYYGDSAIGFSYDVSINDESKLEMVADSTWKFTSSNIETTITMIENDITCWKVHALATDQGENGMTSISKTGEDGMTIWCIMKSIDEKYSSRSLSYSGTFITDIYRNNEPADFCVLGFKPGFNSTITTSRD